jgi:hypothetical protein
VLDRINRIVERQIPITNPECRFHVSNVTGLRSVRIARIINQMATMTQEQKEVFLTQLESEPAST